MPQKIDDPTEVLPNEIPRHEADANSVGLFQLNGDLLDSSGNGRDLTEQGTVAYGLAGEIGYLASQVMEPTDSDYGESLDTDFHITGELTIMCMVRIDSGFSGLQNMVSCTPDPPGVDTDPANNILYRWAVTTGRRLQYLCETGAGTNIIAEDATLGQLNTDQWYHVAMTRASDGDIYLYLDGVEGPEFVKSSPTGGANCKLRVGYHAAANTAVDGGLGSLLISDRVYTAGEISTIASTMLAGWEAP